MTSPIHRCCVELPATWKIVRLFRSDGVDSVGFWTGKDFMASGLHVSPWGWQEIDPMDSYEASRYVAMAIGSTPSIQNEGAESIRDANEEKPRPFHVVRLCLSTGQEIFGLWDGKVFIHHGQEVQPVGWKMLRAAA